MDASSWEAQPAAKQCPSSEARAGFLPPGLASTGTVTEVIRVHQSLEDSHLCLLYNSSPHPQQPIWSAVGLTLN